MGLGVVGWERGDGRGDLREGVCERGAGRVGLGECGCERWDGR